MTGIIVIYIVVSPWDSNIPQRHRSNTQGHTVSKLKELMRWVREDRGEGYISAWELIILALLFQILFVSCHSPATQNHGQYKQREHPAYSARKNSSPLHLSQISGAGKGGKQGKSLLLWHENLADSATVCKHLLVLNSPYTCTTLLIPMTCCLCAFQPGIRQHL